VSAATDDLDKLDEAFKSLRTSYEKYFAGVEKLEPAKSRETFKKTLRRLMTERTSNTARRYRLQSLQASLVTHESYWNRLCRQIEEGNFKRDKWRVQMRYAEQQPQEPVEVAAPEASAGGYPASLVQLHEAYVKARESLGDLRPIAIAAFATTVQKQVAILRTQFGAAAVEFKIAIKDGRVILKAVPKGADGAPLAVGDASS